MKKWILLIALFVVAVSITGCAGNNMDPDGLSKPGFHYMLNDDGTGYVVRKYTQEKKDVSVNIAVPEAYEGLPVVAIGDSAFSGCDKVQSVTLPESITSIGGFAFSGCESLKEINLPDGIKNIGEGAFKKCKALASITIPEGVTALSSNLFSECTALANVTIHDEVVWVGDFVFEKCTSLTKISLSDAAYHIGEGAFADCSGLTEIQLIETSVEHLIDKDPDTFIGLRGKAFAGCTSLKSFTIPRCISQVEWKEVIINQDIVNRDESGVPIGRTTTYLDLEIKVHPNSRYFKVVGNYIYSHDEKVLYFCIDNDSVTSVEIPDGVERLESGVFQQCKNLTHVKVPASLVEGLANAVVITKVTFEIDENNPVYFIENGSLMEKVISED